MNTHALIHSCFDAGCASCQLGARQPILTQASLVVTAAVLPFNYGRSTDLGFKVYKSSFPTVNSFFSIFSLGLAL